MSTVQKINTARWEIQGLIAYDGEPEDYQEWRDAIDGEPVVVETVLLGWDEYETIVRLIGVDGSPVYYLVTSDYRIGEQMEGVWFVGDSTECLFAAYTQKEAAHWAAEYNSRDETDEEHRDPANIYFVRFDELDDMPCERYVIQNRLEEDVVRWRQETS